MKKIFAFLILFHSCISILEAQNIWEPLNLPGSLRAVNKQGDMFCIQYTHPRNLLRSQDNGETWETVFTGNIGNCIPQMIMATLGSRHLLLMKARAITISAV